MVHINFSKLKNQVTWALDIGGTLTKIIILKPVSYHLDLITFLDSITYNPGSHLDLPVYDNHEIVATFLFRYIDSTGVLNFIQQLKAYGLNNENLFITGGGAHKYQKAFENEIQFTVNKLDEMYSIIKALSFILNKPDELIRFDLPKYVIKNETLTCNIYPYLVMNIGSGVSIIKVESATKFKRVSGTCLGGGTVLGLAKTLLGVTTFDSVMELAEKGSNCLDLTVADLTGDSAGSSTLPGNLLASSFGRLEPCWSMDIDLDEIKKPENIARSLVFMIAHNLGYLSYLIGTFQETYRIIFTGKFVQKNPTIMQAITNGVEFYKTTYHYKNKPEQSQIPEKLVAQKYSLNETNDSGSDIHPFEVM